MLSTQNSNSFVADQLCNADEAERHLSATNEPNSPGEDHLSPVDETPLAVPSPGEHQPIIDQIRYWHRQRRYAMEQRKRADLALGSFLRLMLGWRKDLPEKERDAIKKQALTLVKSPGDSEWADLINASVQSRAPFDAIEAKSLKSMSKLAEALPVWTEFGKDVRGFGAASLAVILAEAGDLTNYPKKGHLWKRLGVAVLDGIRQGGLSKNAGAEAWIEHGYNRERRSMIWNIGDTMLKAQVRKVKDSDGEDTGERVSLGVYGQAYLDRKAYELARAPDMPPIQAHRRAQRYMEKRLLRDLWQAWRRDHGSLGESPERDCPDAQFLQAAE